MGKYSSSSAQSKPLFLLSLAASLALHAGGIYFLLQHPPSFLTAKELPTVEHLIREKGDVDRAAHQAFQNLVIREDQDNGLPPPASAPSFESGTIPFIMTELDISLTCPEKKQEKINFDIAAYAPQLFENPWITSKDSPFRDKKRVNFNRVIAKNSSEELAPIPHVSAKKSDENLRQPFIEEKEEKKDFLSENLFPDHQQEKYPSTAPFAFNHPKESSELIDRNILLKKPSTDIPLSLKHPKTQLQPSQHKQESHTELDKILPRVEENERFSFDAETYAYYFDYKSETPIYPFSFKKELEERFIVSAFAHKKRTCMGNPSFTTHTFNSLTWADVSQLSEERDEIVWTPSQEGFNNEWSFQIAAPIVDIAASSMVPEFKELQMSVAAGERRNYCAPKAPLSHQELAQREFGPKPYLDTWKTEEERLEIAYVPEKEGVYPDPTRYSLPNGPTITVELGNTVFCFTLTPSFDLFTSEDAITPPKKMQKFVASNLGVEHSYFPSEAFANNRSSPQLKSSTAPTFTEDSFTLQSPYESSSSTFEFLKEDAKETLPMISDGVTFPEGRTSPSRMRLESKSQTYLSTALGTEGRGAAQEPSIEHVVPSLSEKSIALDSNEYPSPSHLDLKIDQSVVLELQEGESAFDKQIEKEFTSIKLESLSLPNVKDKRVTPQKSIVSGNILLDTLPKFDQMIATTPQEIRPSLLIETESLAPLKDTLHEPIRPSFYPPKIPHLTMEESSLSMLEENLEYVIKQTDTTFVEAIENLPLPYLGSKQMTPRKHPTTPQKAFEDLAAQSVIADLASRDLKYPNTKKLIEKEYAPSKILTDVSIASASIEQPDTDMIHSQAKEILEDYNQENSAPSGGVALATPEIKRGLSETEARSLNQSSRFTQAFLTEIPPPSYLETTTYKEEFDTQVHYSRREDGKGYLFAIKMKAKPSLHFSSPHQNFIFVIDGSSSIKKHRFGVFKEGVSRSLGYLKEGDSFNILVADAELIPFSKTSVAWNSKSKEQANRFLYDRKYRGFFINYDSFDLLSSVTKYLDPEKENVIVMITDGHSFQNLKAHKEDFQELAQASKGRFSVHTATASSDNNLTMLDLLSTFNSGELMYSKTHAAFSRQLAVMVKHIENLVAKDVQIHVTDVKQETGIEFYPNQHTLPPLYADRAYTIYGTIDDLKDFDLILQGRCGDQWVNIKQHISFKHAEKASNTIKRGFALQRAYVCYDYYLKKNDPFFLAEAERILNPHAIPTATR
jgi:hypothetical protein